MMPQQPELLTKKLHKDIERYRQIISHWNASTNLMATADIKDVHLFHTRHILDSAQLINAVQDTPHIADIGTGAGFPGIVLALLARELGSDQTVHLVESREKRILFLKEARRQLKLDNVVVHYDRIEALPPLPVTLFVSRAFRVLKDTLPLLRPHLTPETRYITLKGETWEQEVADAQRTWHFDLAISPSLTHSKSGVLHISNITRQS